MLPPSACLGFILGDTLVLGLLPERDQVSGLAQSMAALWTDVLVPVSQHRFGIQPLTLSVGGEISTTD